MLEYLVVGRALERCRLHFLPRLLDRRHVLALGDGDGRALAALLQLNPNLAADAVDISAAMLELLAKRCNTVGCKRVKTHLEDARFYNASRTVDLVTAHFFFDCFTQHDLELLVTGLAAQVSKRAIWIVSDFRVPEGAVRGAAAILVRGLYLSFRLLTGLRTTKLPDHEAALERAGLSRIACHRSLFGILTTELWQAQA